MRALIPAAAMALVACSGKQSVLNPAGDQASALHHLLVLTFLVCGSVYILVLGGLAWSVLRLRRAAASNHADTVLARSIWGAAAIIVTGLTVLIVGSFIADRALFATRGEDAMLVRVTGHQWWWRIEYRLPGQDRWIETANELHLPLGRTTRIVLGSGDVIHSFWVPNVAGKIDMIPGRRNVLDVTPRKEGWFRGQCTEYCGTQHAHMAFDVKVVPPPSFDAWLTAQDSPAWQGVDPAAARGRTVFADACASCHVVRGTGAVGRAGPDLTHVASRRSVAAGTLRMSRGALQAWIAQPQALKPGTSMPTIPLAPVDADAVAHYLARLR